MVRHIAENVAIQTNITVGDNKPIYVDTAQLKSLLWSSGNARFEFNDSVRLMAAGDFEIYNAAATPTKIFDIDGATGRTNIAENLTVLGTVLIDDATAAPTTEKFRINFGDTNPVVTDDITGLDVRSRWGNANVSGAGIGSDVVSGGLTTVSNTLANYTASIETHASDIAGSAYFAYVAWEVDNLGGSASTFGFAVEEGYDYDFVAIGCDMTIEAIGVSVGNGPNITITAGDATSSGDGGVLSLKGGAKAGAGSDGYVEVVGTGSYPFRVEAAITTSLVGAVLIARTGVCNTSIGLSITQIGGTAVNYGALIETTGTAVDNTGVQGRATGVGTTNYGVRGEASGATTGNYGLYGEATDADSNVGIYAKGHGAATTNFGLFSEASGANTDYGVYSKVTGSSSGSAGVQGEALTTSGSAYGGKFSATGAATINYGIYGEASGAGTNYAGYFNGYTYVTGTAAGLLTVEAAITISLAGAIFVNRTGVCDVSHGLVAQQVGGTVTNSAVWAKTSGTGTNNYGVHGEANGAGTSNYGLYGTAENATTNWAGYFAAGNVKIENELWVGTYAAKSAEAFAGYITIKDAAGNDRKVMVCV